MNRTQPGEIVKVFKLRLSYIVSYTVITGGRWTIIQECPLAANLPRRTLTPETEGLTSVSGAGSEAKYVRENYINLSAGILVSLNTGARFRWQLLDHSTQGSMRTWTGDNGFARISVRSQACVLEERVDRAGAKRGSVVSRAWHAFGLAIDSSNLVVDCGGVPTSDEKVCGLQSSRVT